MYVCVCVLKKRKNWVFCYILSYMEAKQFQRDGILGPPSKSPDPCHLS